MFYISDDIKTDLTTYGLGTLNQLPVLQQVRCVIRALQNIYDGTL